MIHVYYHRMDLDGLCCGALAYRYYKNTAMYHGMDYGESISYDTDAELNLFLDFVPSADEPIPENLYVIDHHKTSVGLPGKIDTTQAACVLAWNHFRTGSVPLAVEMIADADTYQTNRPNWLTEIVPFVLAVQSWGLSIFDATWDTLFDGTCDYHRYLIEGAAIKRDRDFMNARLCREQAFTTYFAGFTVLAIIGGDRGSARFIGYESETNHDFVMVIRNIKNHYWKYSMYSSTVDVSEIAQQYGGGGHKGAAGFTHEDLIV